MTASEQYRIITPTPDDAPELLKLRTWLYREELATAGVSADAIARHTEGWLESVAAYRQSLTMRLAGRCAYVRAVAVPEPDGVRLAGIFEADMAGIVPVHAVYIVQIEKSLRGQGIGRALFETFWQQANPAIATELTVLDGNAPARGFYKHMRFTELGTGETHTIGGQEMPTVRLRYDPSQS